MELKFNTFTTPDTETCQDILTNSSMKNKMNQKTPTALFLETGIDLAIID